MYQSSYSGPQSGYVSPPSTYRSSPIPVNPSQPYISSFSPPPAGNGFSPISSGPMQPPGRYQQYQPYRSPPQNGQNAHGAQKPYPQSGYQHPAAPRHKGTLPPGQIIRVGEHSVKIERYLSEGGYAHVYLTSSERPIYPPKGGRDQHTGRGNGYKEHCLKRIAFEDENVWKEVNKEIEVMKTLPTSPYLTTYLASSHSRLPKGGYEVFILMEFCAGGGIIDLLNKRLRDRLSEVEILNIFTDVCEAVAVMHALPRPLLHRDLKIENILSAPSADPPTVLRPMPLIFKLCDFGSTTFPASHPPASKAEADALSMDLNRHTTLQYRSPEMVEPLLGWAVGLPSDVWALGVLLYKLCYYTTPFEEHGTLAIVNAKYTFPQFPVYSPRIQHLIASLLVEQPLRRPSVFEILKVAHEMSGSKPFIDYPSSSRSVSIPQAEKPKPQSVSSGRDDNLLDFTSSNAAEANAVPLIPSIQPQRRGRPTREPAAQPQIQPSTPAATVSAKVQVTGEAEKADRSSSLDAFGMTSTSHANSPSNGFGDSFGATSPVSSAVSTQRTNLSHDRRAIVAGQLYKPPFRKTSSSNKDAFGASTSAPSPSQNLQDTRSAPATFSPAFGNDFAPRVLSPVKTNLKDTGVLTSAPDKESTSESTFEMRFPSIESLAGDDNRQTQSAEARPDVSRRPTDTQGLLSPSTRPTIHSKPSFPMRSLTGGEKDITVPHLPTINQGPQPRSTQVTGTAFNAVSDRSPGLPVKPQGPLGDAPLLSPQDLLSGEESHDLKLPSLRPSSSYLSKTTSADSKEPTRPRPTPVIAPKSNSNILSDKWSPLEDMKKITPPGKDDSSGDEEGPEDPSARFGSFRGKVPGTSPAAASKTPSVQESQTSSSASRSNQQWRRPQSMALPPKPSVALLVPSDDNTRNSISPSIPPEARPTLHSRRSSVTDMVSQYEQLKSPSSSSSLAGSKSPVKPASVKPLISVKPHTLRKPSTSTIQATSVSDSNTLRRTSSTRPATKPKPVVSTPATPTDATPAGEADSTSPEKQQPVNLLIQRWNQGEVGSKPKSRPPVAKKTFI